MPHFVRNSAWGSLKGVNDNRGVGKVVSNPNKESGGCRPGQYASGGLAGNAEPQRVPGEDSHRENAKGAKGKVAVGHALACLFDQLRMHAVACPTRTPGTAWQDLMNHPCSIRVSSVAKNVFGLFPLPPGRKEGILATDATRIEHG